jgi:hypothetical protein
MIAMLISGCAATAGGKAAQGICIGGGTLLIGLGVADNTLTNLPPIDDPHPMPADTSAGRGLVLAGVGFYALAIVLGIIDRDPGPTVIE